MPAPARSNRLTTIAGLALIVAGIWTGWLAWRNNEAKHRAMMEDQAAMHAELRAAAQTRADLERRATRLERNDVEFREFATKAHGETHKMLKELIERAGGTP